MRIAILAVILILLLSPGLRSSAAPSSLTPLHPTPAFPRASGTVQAERRGDRATLTVAVRDLPLQIQNAGGAGPVYVAWLVDEERRLYNLGRLTTDGAGNAVSTFTPIDPPTGTVILAVSAEPRGDLRAPTAPRMTVILSGQIALGTILTTPRLDSDFGPDWFAPILPATLGLTLLRHAARARRAELRARQPIVPTPAADS